MLQWMVVPFRRYAEFSGRSRRIEFWIFALLNVVVYTVITAIMMGSGLSVAALEDAGNAGPMAMVPMLFGGFGVLAFIWWLVTLVPGIAVTVRRLHDRDLSGWWYLGFVVLSLVPVIGVIASIAMLVVLLLPGTPGPNRFGLDPKDPASVEVFA